MSRRHLAPGPMPGNSRLGVVRNHPKVARLIWTSCGVISTASSASCLAARVAPKNPKALVARAVALAVLSCLHSSKTWAWV